MCLQRTILYLHTVLKTARKLVSYRINEFRYYPVVIQWDYNSHGYPVYKTECRTFLPQVLSSFWVLFSQWKASQLTRFWVSHIRVSCDSVTSHTKKTRVVSITPQKTLKYLSSFPFIDSTNISRPRHKVNMYSFLNLRKVVIVAKP